MTDNTELVIQLKAQTKELSDLTAKIGQLTDGLGKTGKEADKAGGSFDKFL